MHWRRIGSIQLITGPDVAHSTVQPHQLLDFLTGRLERHFIGDARSHKIALARDGAGREPFGRERCEIEFRIVCRDHIRQNASRGG